MDQKIFSVTSLKLMKYKYKLKAKKKPDKNIQFIKELYTNYNTKDVNHSSYSNHPQVVIHTDPGSIVAPMSIPKINKIYQILKKLILTKNPKR